MSVHTTHHPPRPAATPEVFDPIRFCVFTTIALLAWLLGPPVAVVLTSGLGLWAYGYAWRKGLRESRCLLGDPRLVMGYLGAAFVVGSIFLVRGVVHLLEP